MQAESPARLSNWSIEHVARPCAIAISFVMVALLWTFPLQRYIAYPFVFLFFGAVMGSAWFGGFFAGFVAVVFSSFLIAYFFVPPFYSITIGKESQSFFAAFVLFRHRHYHRQFGAKACGECNSSRTRST